MQRTETGATPAAIWTRLLRPGRNDMPPEVARYFLNLAFDQQDADRMHALAVKNQEGELTPNEQDQLNAYRQIGLELDLLRAKARLAVQTANGR